MKHKLFGPIDIIVIIGILAITAAFIPYMHVQGSDMVIIFRDNQEIASYPITGNRQISLSGTTGKLTVSISEGKAHIEKSSCRKQICVHSLPIKYPGQQIVCAPNHIIVQIGTSKKNEEIDAVAR